MNWLKTQEQCMSGAEALMWPKQCSAEFSLVPWAKAWVNARLGFATAPLHTYMSPTTQLNRSVLKSSLYYMCFHFGAANFWGFGYGSHSLYSVAYLDNPKTD